MVFVPDGVSRFNIRGWQGRGRSYSADGLVLFAVPDSRISRPGELRVTCVGNGISAGWWCLICHHPEEIPHERPNPADARCHRTDKGRAVLAPRLHDRIRRRRGGLYAGRRSRAGRRHQDRHRRPRCRRHQDQGRRRRDARLFRAPERRRQSAGHCWSRWRSSACTNTSRTSRGVWPSSARSPSRPTIISARASTSPRSPTFRSFCRS